MGQKEEDIKTGEDRGIRGVTEEEAAAETLKAIQSLNQSVENSWQIWMKPKEEEEGAPGKQQRRLRCLRPVWTK